MPTVENLPLIDLLEVQRFLDNMPSMRLDPPEANLALVQSFAELVHGKVVRIQIIDRIPQLNAIVVEYDCEAAFQSIRSFARLGSSRTSDDNSSVIFFVV